MVRGAIVDGDGIQIEISDTQGHWRGNRSEMIDLMRRTLLAEGHREASVSLALVDQASIHEINRVHLGHDWPTDVISFPLSNPDDVVLSGELVVSAEMAVLTAADSGVEPREELALYIVHGLLHLCGHDDTTESGAAEMRRREDEILSASGITNPFSAIRKDEAPPEPASSQPILTGVPRSPIEPTEARQWTG